MTAAAWTMRLRPRPPKIDWWGLLAVMIALTVVAVLGGVTP